MISEYDWLLEQYVQIVAIEPVTSTFINITKEEREEFLKSVTYLRHKFEWILPIIQNRELLKGENLKSVKS